MRLHPTRVDRLLDVAPGRCGKCYGDWIAAREQHWRQEVRVAALDPFRGYLNALRRQLPHAAHVLDAFHVTRLGLQALDEVPPCPTTNPRSSGPRRRPAV